MLTQPGRQRWLLIEALCCSESSLPCMTYPSLVRKVVGEGHSCLQELKTVLISGIFLWCKLSEITRQSWGYWGMHHKMLLGKPALLFRPTWQVWKLKIRTSSIFGDHTANSWFVSLRIRGESAHMEIAHLGHGLSKTPGSWNCLYNFLAEKNSTLVCVDNERKPPEAVRFWSFWKVTERTV